MKKITLLTYERKPGGLKLVLACNWLASNSGEGVGTLSNLEALTLPLVPHEIIWQMAGILFSRI